ncbi:MAG: hypothetical protein LBH08_01400 [Puniceicoccales bacterium]|jgi:hypothetical protein|nr:hypothetical protein [Puniceicoccales bacterium]
MSTYTPFLCHVTPYGTPFFVPLKSSADTFMISNLSAEELCRNYWLLESLTIYYKLIFSGSLEITGNLSLGGMYATAPRMRLLNVPSFQGTIFHSSSGVQADGNVDFSSIYHQSDGLYAVNFDFAIYARVETISGSNFLVSFYRSVGHSSQRNSYKTQTVNFLGKSITVYLNYNDQIWESDEIELAEFSLAAVLYDNNTPQRESSSV